jgi:hypothetical protein
MFFMRVEWSLDGFDLHAKHVGVVVQKAIKVIVFRDVTRNRSSCDAGRDEAEYCVSVRQTHS